MPLPLIPLIAAGGAIVGSAINAGSQAATNSANRRHAKEMYEMQKRDNLAQWHLQNEYNSPQAQMARLQQAGLNPHLVYSNGANNTSAPVPTATPTVQQATAPEWGDAVSGGLQTYYDTQIKSAQVDNLKAQNTVAVQEAALKAAQTAGAGIQNAKSKLDYEIASELKQNSLEVATQGLRKLQADTEFQISENERRDALNSTSLQEAAERILSAREARANTVVERQRIRESIQQIRNSNQLAQLDIQLKRAGIQPNDPLYARILGRAIGSGAGDMLKAVDQWTRDKSKSFKEHVSNYFK